jgi:6-phosphofructokinase 1
MRVRLADIHSTQYAIARRYMIRMRLDDFVDPAIVEQLAAACGTDAQQFRSRFEPQTRREPPPLELG